jgi:MerR family transcriptional regulator, thiopeptide resistance regulator
MAWSTSEVARMSRVTSRTLRHYDRIGLLSPASTAANGYRYYEQEQLRRLQQILLYRELGLGLEAIAEVLAGQLDEVEALRRHHERLVAEGARLQRLAGTVSRTIASLTGDADMTVEEMFDGFTARQQQWEADLVERLGDGVRLHIEAAREARKGMTKQDYLVAEKEWAAFDGRMVEAIQDGCSVDEPRVTALLDEHLAMVSRHWTPDAASYAGLGRLYVEHPEFKARYDARDPRLAEFLRDAMASYAESGFSE